MALQILRPAIAEPLDLAAVKAHLRIDTNDDDAMLVRYLAAARDDAEQAIHQQLIAARLRYTYALPLPATAPIRLPKGPVISIESISYKVIEGPLIPVDLATDVNIEDGFHPIISPPLNRAWPWGSGCHGTVMIDYVAGYCTPITVDTDADTVIPAFWRTLAEGDMVRLSNSGGALPAGLTPGIFYVHSVPTAGSYKLAATPGGTPLAITGTGTGTHYLGQPGRGGSEGAIPANLISWMLIRAETLYSHRGEQAVVRGGTLAKLDHVDRLLDPYRLINL